MSWHRCENGQDSRPVEVDDFSSHVYVYVRRNITHVDGTEERPAHYEWDELKIPRESWESWEQSEMNADAIEEMAGISADNADMVEVLSQAVEELASIIGGE